MRVPEFWHTRPGLAAGLLTPLGAAWDGVGRLRRAVTRPYRAPMPVICVGNLVAGGSGKTPVALSLAERLQTRGIAVHVVSRGYGGRLTGPIRVDPLRHDAAEVGDEPLLIAALAPCWVARDRAAGIAAAVAAGAEAVLLDDGFQNPSIEKDLALLVVDGEYGFGNRRIIPAGPLREPIAAGLARADAIVLIGTGEAPPELQDTPCPRLRARLSSVNAAGFTGAKVVAFAGIGRPEKFFASLSRAGADIVAARPFPDHHRYAGREIARLRDEAEGAGAGLVTTAKDWVRLPPALRNGIRVFEVALQWQDEAALDRLLDAVLTRNADAGERDAAGG